MESTFNKHLEKYKNIHKGKTAILFATGPSINEYKSLENSDDFIKFGVNTIYNFPYILKELDYYFYGSHYYIDSSHRENIEKTCSLKNITSFASAYEEGRSHKDINRGNITPERALELGSEPFENNLSIFTNDIANYSTLGHSIIFPIMQFILYMGFTKIYLVGCDGGFTSTDSYDMHLLYWWNECKKFIDIYYPNVEIISVNPVSLKGWFKDIIINI